ncbi:MAG: bifunctional aconitate hydratase 2/2-methylisocitrate dehydratase [Proteobacteria bacterium]|nr:bifunctional aconitate hydratase 2/2-methylisocitrate dehydratase [Pseudomonadota bacterium]
MIKKYLEHVEARSKMNIDPQPLDSFQVMALAELLVHPPAGDEAFLLNLFENRIPSGVDTAAKIKAEFLSEIVSGNLSSPLIDKQKATRILGTMGGGYNIDILVKLLDDFALADEAADALSHAILVFDSVLRVFEKAKHNIYAKNVIHAWRDALWFEKKDKLPEKMMLCVYKVDGEINTDDFSPASEAWSRPDIPLHALSMLQKRAEDPLSKLNRLKEKGLPIAFAGDVVGTGSSRKSAANSLLWHIGTDIPFVPNKRQGGVVLGGKIAPIFYNTLEDAGALPVECDVSGLKSGDIIQLHPYEGKIVHHETGKIVSRFTLKSSVIFDSVQAGGRIHLIIGRCLTNTVRKLLGLEPSAIFRNAKVPKDTGKGYTLAQKIVGKACGVKGVRPGTYCEPKMTTVGSQDTTGPMTRDELKELACLKFSAGLVMQSFCHTAAYPKKVDISMHQTLPQFFRERGGVALKPGDGVIHSWLNRMVLPDTVGTGGDSHTRFPLGISFPAGSGLVAFGAALGTMPLDMPESVRVRFKGKRQPGVTIRDLVNAIPYVAIERGLLTVAKEGKKNVFSGRILEIEGLEELEVDQAFELTDSSAERSAAAATIRLSKEAVISNIKSNLALLKWMRRNGYNDHETLEKRIREMELWLTAPELLVADPDAKYIEEIEVHLDQIKEPILACPNDPDDVRLLSDVAGTPVDEVFIGSCMTNIGHFRAAATLLNGGKKVKAALWMTPPTRMDQKQLREEGLYSIFGKAGVRMEIPGCSLCMGNQARVNDKAVVVSTSTRNFPERMGNGARVYLASAELSVMSALLGHIPFPEEYMRMIGMIESSKDQIYRNLKFDELEDYCEALI